MSSRSVITSSFSKFGGSVVVLAMAAVLLAPLSASLLKRKRRHRVRTGIRQTIEDARLRPAPHQA